MSRLRVLISSADAMTDLGRRLATIVRAGDLLVLDGPLGAGKTTLTRGLGEALGVRGQVTSPTFVIARRHRGAGGVPGLLHVDAYRVSAAELLDQELDLEAVDFVAVVEWGAAKVADWSADRLLVVIEPLGDDPDGPREVTLEPVGPRWAGVALAEVVGAA